MLEQPARLHSSLLPHEEGRRGRRYPALQPLLKSHKWLPRSTGLLGEISEQQEKLSEAVAAYPLMAADWDVPSRSATSSPLECAPSPRLDRASAGLQLPTGRRD